MWEGATKQTKAAIRRIAVERPTGAELANRSERAYGLVAVAPIPLGGVQLGEGGDGSCGIPFTFVSLAGCSGRSASSSPALNWRLEQNHWTSHPQGGRPGDRGITP